MARHLIGRNGDGDGDGDGNGSGSGSGCRRGQAPESESRIEKEEPLCGPCVSPHLPVASTTRNKGDARLTLSQEGSGNLAQL